MSHSQITSNSQSRILLIDDEAILLEALQDILANKYQVKSTSNAKEALAFIEKGEVFECIICDLMMPHMDGIQFFEGIRKISPQHLSRMIFMTGGSYTEKVEKFLKSPGIIFCEKPMRIRTLEKLVQNLLDQEGLKKEIKAS